MKRWGFRSLASAAVWGAMAAIGTVWIAQPAQALTNSEIAMLKGPDRQKILLEGAKKEGKVVLYGPFAVNTTIAAFAKVFDEKYGIKFESIRGGTVETMQRVSTEIKAKNQFGDLMEGGTGAIPAIKGGMVEAFYSPSLEAYDKSMYEPHGLWAPSRTAYMGLAYNTKLISAADMPKNFDGLLDPKLKGKMVWVASTDAGAPLFIANLLELWGQPKTEEYLKKLAAQNVVPFPSDLSNMVNRVGQGEYTIAIHAPGHDPIRYGKQGAPLDTQMMDPIPSLLNAIQLIKGAPHPHAAMLFLDYFLSEEGQELLMSTGYIAVHPKVNLGSDLNKIVPRLVGMKEFTVTPEKLFEYRDISNQLYKKYFDN